MDFPSAELDAIRRLNSEILFGGSGAGEHLGGLFQALRIQAHRVENARSDRVAGKRSHNGSEREQNDDDVGSPAHPCL
jgi:hypothetical protein